MINDRLQDHLMLTDIDQVEGLFYSDDTTTRRLTETSIEQIDRCLDLVLRGQVLRISAANRDTEHIADV